MDINDVFNPLEAGKYNLGEGTQLLDADTAEITVDGEEKRLRILGLGAEETTKIDSDTGLFKRGSDVGQLQHNVLAKLGQGYNQAILSGEQDKYGRELGDLYNEDTNEFFASKAQYHGIVQPGYKATTGAANLGLLGGAERKIREEEGQTNEWDVAGDLLRNTRQLQPILTKGYAETAADYARDPKSYIGAGTVLKGRTQMDEARNWFTDDLGYGVGSVGNAFLGGFDLISDFFSKEPNAIDQVLKDRAVHESFGPNRQHLNPFDEKGDWKLDSVGEYAKFFIGNFAVSAPYMATLIASSVVPWGGAYIIPSLMYSGEVYNEQGEEKNPYMAITAGVGMAALDKFGLDLIFRNKYGRDLLENAASRKKVVQEIAKKRGVSLEVAEQTVAKGITRELARFSDSYKTYIGTQLKAGAIAKNAVARTGIGAVGEGGTEVIQELVQHWGSGQEVDPAAFQQRMITAAIAGGGIGGALGGVGAGVSTLGLYDAKRAGDTTVKAQAENVQAQGRAREAQVREGHGDGTTNRSKSQTMDDWDKTAEKEVGDKTASLEEQAKDRPKGFWARPKAYIQDRNLMNFWRSGFLDARYDKLKQLPIISSLIGANSQEHNQNTGANYETSVDNNSAFVESTTADQQQDEARFNLSSDAISAIMYDENNVSIFTRIAEELNNPNSPYTSFKEAYAALGLRLSPEAEANAEAFLEKAEELEEFWRTKGNLDGSQYTPGGFYAHTSFDQALLDAQRKKVAEEIAAKLGVSQADVVEAVEALVLDDFVASDDLVVDPFAPEAATESSSTLEAKVKNELLNSPEFAHLRDKNIHISQKKASYGAGRYKANVDFFGEETSSAPKGDRIARILDLAEKRGEITAEEKAGLAGDFLDQMQIYSGHFRETSRGFRITQNHLMFFSTIAVLPLATVSSIVETGLLGLGMTPAQQFNLFQPLAKNLAVEMVDAVNETLKAPASIVGVNKRTSFDKTKLVESAAMTTALGYNQTSKSSQARMEGGDNHQIAPRWQTVTMDAFFRGTMLTNWTDGMRTVVAGAAVDVMWGWLEEIQINGTSTVFGREAAGMLADLGVNVENFQKIAAADVNNIVLARKKSELTPEEMQLELELRSALTNFVDQRVAMPSKTNRPKIYYDPKFKLFTHLTGYIATLTSTILPRMYKNLVSGTPGLTYGAFTVIATMFILGFLSQWLKDELKYGGEPPWLNDGMKFQRALYSSGLLGITERGIDIAFPLYEDRKQGLDKYLSTARGELPALSWLHGGASGIFDIAQGETAKGVQNSLKLTPLAPFYKQRKDIAEYFK